MKKYSIILFSVFLISCANNPMEETRDELEIRKTETLEQTLIRHNEIIAAIKKQVAEKQATQQIRLQIPNTCEEINEQQNVFLTKFADFRKNIEKYEDITNKSQNTCSFCKSNDYSEFIKISENAEVQIKSIMTTKYLGISLHDNPNDDEKKYIQRIDELCIQGNQNEQVYFSNLQASEIEQADETFKNTITEMKNKCDEYNPDNLKKARRAIQEKYELIKNNPLLVTVEDECRHKFWGATSKQCSCYTRAYFDEIKKLALKSIEEKEHCTEYHNDFAIFQIESNARKKCGL